MSGWSLVILWENVSGAENSNSEQESLGRLKQWLKETQVKPIVLLMNDKTKRIKHEEDYIAFLEKRLSSKNFKANVSKEEFDKTAEKLKKAKLVLKILRS